KTSVAAAAQRRRNQRARWLRGPIELSERHGAGRPSGRPEPPATAGERWARRHADRRRDRLPPPPATLTGWLGDRHEADRRKQERRGKDHGEDQHLGSLSYVAPSIAALACRRRRQVAGGDVAAA